MATRDEWITLDEARDWLGVSLPKLRELLKLGAAGDPHGLPSSPDPLDKRAKRVKVADVEALLRQSPTKNIA